MLKMLRMAFACLACSILLVSCRSTFRVSSAPRTLPEAFPNHSVSQILALLPSVPAAFDTLYAETIVSLSSPDESGRFSTRIAFHRGDSLLIRIRFPLGIEGARVLITADSAWIYDRIHEEVVAGSRASITNMLPGAVLGPNLVDDALDFIAPDPDIAWKLSADTIRYHLISPDSTVRIVVDPSLWRVVHIEQKDATGTVLEQRWYTEFKTFNQHVLPLRLIVSRPVENTRLSMVIREIDTTPGRLSFDLGLKRDTRRILTR